MMSGLLVEFDFFFGINRHVPEDSTCFTFIFCFFSRHFDAVLFADILEDVRGGLVKSIYVLGLF